MRSSRKADYNPAFQFYPSDWLVEPGLRLCDLAARGLWIDILAISFRLESRGEMRVGGQALSTTQIAQMVGQPLADVERAIEQLLSNGVAEKSDDGCIYCRRMVREEKQRRSKVSAGRAGGLKAHGQVKGGSSSSSSSSYKEISKESTEQNPSRNRAGTSKVEAPLTTDQVIARIEELRARGIPPVIWRTLASTLPPEVRARFMDASPAKGPQDFSNIIGGQGPSGNSNGKTPAASLDGPLADGVVPDGAER